MPGARLAVAGLLPVHDIWEEPPTLPGNGRSLPSLFWAVS
jgi:hypothetical protein